MKRFLLLLLLTPLFALAQQTRTKGWKPLLVRYSPDGTIIADAYLTHKNTLAIDIIVDRQLMLSIDSIGWQTDQGDYVCFDGIKKITKESYSAAQTNTPLWGPNKTAIPHCPQWTQTIILSLSQKEGFAIFRLWVSDEGVAYQIGFGEQLHSPLKRIVREYTRYQFPCDGTAWSIPANFESYEFLYRRQPISQTQDANTPFTFCLNNNLWGSIHEALLDGFPEMTLVQDRPLSFRTWLSPSADKEHAFAISLPPAQLHCSSIRAITIGRSAKDIANSRLAEGIIPSVQHQDTSFPLSSIRPMKYIGIWWGMHLGVNSWTPDHRHGATTENALRHIDFAAANNIDAVLIEGWNKGWDTWGKSQQFSYTEAAEDLDIEQVCRYAKSKGVEIIIHHETGGNWNDYERQLDSIFRWCIAHDIHAIKTGYAGGYPDQELHHSLVGVNHYNNVMRKAAEYGIMLDVHEPIKPTGWNWIYPNLMTGEGVRGQEWNAWSDGNPPSHTCTLPFTRCLAGPVDYTPGIFDITYRCIQNDTNCHQWNMKDARECSVHTTLCHQMALWVILYSPWQMAADFITNYENHPCFQFFRNFDPDPDWSQMLDGYPGEYAVTVRRANGQYFIGAITNESSRTISVPLHFLPNDKHFMCTLYCDAENAHFEKNPTAYKISQMEVTSETLIPLFLAPGGGCAIYIQPIENANNPSSTN